MQPALTPSMELLFQEFLRRYRELQAAKALETIWFTCAVLLGTAVVILPWIFPDKGLPLTGIALIFLFLIVHQYIRQNQRVEHLSVNVHVLHHHLLGKLEVGFCEHLLDCSCAEDFRRHVWQNYGISLNGGSLEERY
ncbi:hypothetical protein [Paradesulfitobacterium ferrireducens]|uniref:hypothetical protein n=1 Tax=Paradesulfitobacterium ferrireducens TaxID=2816476 RepID=UPI001A8DE962|nr:hypothetical protein [Paradesulfitobacterium ferrireducens]